MGKVTIQPMSEETRKHYEGSFVISIPSLPRRREPTQGEDEVKEEGDGVALEESEGV